MNRNLPDTVYTSSVNELCGGVLFMADLGPEDGLFFAGSSCPFENAEAADPDMFESVRFSAPLWRIPKDHASVRRLWELLPWTGPQQILAKERTFGTGDRLGIATIGHIRAVEKYDVYPVFSQQSMRELTLTGRTYENVLDDVTFQVLLTGYKKGYGADGDHLKSAEDILMEIGCGASMITLDCSDHIHCERKTAEVPEELKSRYLSGPIRTGSVTFSFTEETLSEAVAIFGEAVDFAVKIYETCIKGKPVDLEISMDETDLSTTPEQHYFVANELLLRGVRFCTMAPRFYGEFQKGVDYIGEPELFRADIEKHAAIADHFGYKLSIHSGSDKFTAFPIIGEVTHEHFHAKTAGTSWLEAIRLVARTDPALFREIYAYAQTVFTECRAYYVVSTEPEMVPSIEGMSDDQLPELLNLDTSRQLLHITYGKVLNEERFRGRLFSLWRANRKQYEILLEKHIGRHLQLLCPKCRVAW